MAKVDVETRGEVAVLRLSNPPVNALAHGVREGLQAAIAAANANPAIKAIVVTGEGRAFSAGADITEFRSGMKPPGLGEVIDNMEASEKPVVAALNGLALGGGLEVALGCHYRVAAPSVTQLGLPEVKIGILPGAGGTQRLPRTIGVEPALDMIVSGNPATAAAAAKAGLVDRIAEGDVVDAAVAFARELIASGKGPRRASDKSIDAASVPAELFDKKRASLGRHPSGPLAPKNCIAAVEASVTLPFRDGLKRERELFSELAASPYARALQYAFFAERQAANIPDIGADVKPREVKSAGIIGAGTMGTGITLAFLNAGIPVTIVETAQTALDKGVARIRETIDSNVARGRISSEEGRLRFANLTPRLGLEELAASDLIIEAVFEKLALKKEIFGKLDAIAKPGAVLATNTSTLDVDAIAAATKRPGDVVGMHFFSPANIMRLLEVVRGKATSKDALATAMAVAKRIGKVGVVSGVCFGFIGNRMLEAYLEEVQAMLLEGATPSEVDGALEAWGLAMGPNAMMDMAGLDVGYHIRQEHKISDERRRLYRFTDAIVGMGRHGQKTGVGYYKYGSDRKRQADPEMEAMIRAEAAAQGVAQRKPSAEEVVERCLLRLVNEGAQILDEGIALRASDIDTIYLTGYGFPAWRGGPMWQAENIIGLKAAAEKIRGYEQVHGPRWAIAPLLERLAASGGKLADVGAVRKPA
jgi:3-hydroxyacyl-CoA dehydrogenase